MFEGMSRTYSKELLEEYEAKNFEYNGKKMTEYEALQEQRKLERQIRRWKREQNALQAAGLDIGEAAAKVREWNGRHKDFLEQTGLKADGARTVVGRSLEMERIRSYGKIVEKSVTSDIMVSGARITNPDSDEANKFAKEYYEAVRKRKTDYQKIAKNIGETEENVLKVKNYLFVDNSLYNEGLGVWMQFPPDCAIAHSWQRLIEGKDIKDHDITLIKHELYEMEIKNKEPGISHSEAHRLAEKRYNYAEGVTKYYGNLKKHNKNK